MTRQAKDSLDQTLDELVFDFSDLGTIDQLVSEAMSDEESSREVLRERWIASTISKLRSLRRSLKLTQQEIADRLGTKQSAIARLEAEDDISLGRLWDYLFACGKSPVEIEYVSYELLREFVAQKPNDAVSKAAILFGSGVHGNQRELNAKSLNQYLPFGSDSHAQNTVPNAISTHDPVGSPFGVGLLSHLQLPTQGSSSKIFESSWTVRNEAAIPSALMKKAA